MFVWRISLYYTLWVAPDSVLLLWYSTTLAESISRNNTNVTSDQLLLAVDNLLHISLSPKTERISIIVIDLSCGEYRISFEDFSYESVSKGPIRLLDHHPGQLETMNLSWPSFHELICIFLFSLSVMKCTGRIKDWSLIIHGFVSYLKYNCKWKDKTINLFQPGPKLDNWLLHKTNQYIWVSWWQVLYFDRALIMRPLACPQ